MTVDIKQILSPRDQNLLKADAINNWIPKDPTTVISSYVKSTEEDKKTFDSQKEKAKAVYDGYGTIIDKCKELEAVIEGQCKNVSIKLDPQKHYTVIQSVRRIFGTDGSEVTFEMYKTCIAELAALGANAIPQPGDKKS